MNDNNAIVTVQEQHAERLRLILENNEWQCTAKDALLAAIEALSTQAKR